MIFSQTSHQEFSSLKQSNTEANEREEVLKKLASAHDSYVEISNNLREGTKVLTQHNSGTQVSARKKRSTAALRIFSENFTFFYSFLCFKVSRKPGNLFLSFFFASPLFSSTTT